MKVKYLASPVQTILYNFFSPLCHNMFGSTGLVMIEKVMGLNPCTRYLSRWVNFAYLIAVKFYR